MRKVIVVLNPESNPWRVIDPELKDCPDSPVYYDQIYTRVPADIIDVCPEVVIINSQTGVKGKGYPLIIEE